MTHSVKVVIQYTTETNTYHVADEFSKPKDPTKPIDVHIPCSKDRIEEDDGEREETLDYSPDNTKTDTFIDKANGYLEEFEGSVP